MVKEFDIYLKRRITECDLIVYSLPYRDGLTATNRIILESCIESYTLQKFVAMQFGSELVSHIDKMIKTCYERLNWGTAISADAVFQTHYIMNPEASAVELAVEDIPALETMFAEAESCMILNAAPLLANIAKSLGHGHTAIAFDGGVRDTLKWGLMSPGDSIVLDAVVSGTQAIDYIKVDAPVVPGTEMVNLCYRITSTASMAMEIAALVLGTELHFSFGRAYGGMAFDAKVSSEHLRKYELVENNLRILADITESIRQFIATDGTAVDISVSASPILKRHRLLAEMDADELSEFNNMTLDEVDFVIL
jgi:hypothetical protein